MIKIAISVVCYNNSEEIISFAKDIEKQTKKDEIVLLVTINSCDNVEKLKKSLDQIDLNITIYNPEKNMGYLYGALYGIEKYKEKNAVKWFVISNTDIEFVDKKFFEHFLQKKIEDVYWGIAPNIRRASTGVAQNPFMVSRPSKLKMFTLKIVYSHILLFYLMNTIFQIKKNILKREVATCPSCEIYALQGSFMILRDLCCDALIKEKTELFLFGEEVLIAEMIRKKKKSIYYYDDIFVVHNENQCTKLIVKKQCMEWSRDSFQIIYDKFFKGE